MHVTGLMTTCGQCGAELWPAWEERDGPSGLLISERHCLRCGAGYIASRRDEQTGRQRADEDEDD